MTSARAAGDIRRRPATEYDRNLDHPENVLHLEQRISAGNGKEREQMQMDEPAQVRRPLPRAALPLVAVLLVIASQATAQTETAADETGTPPAAGLRVSLACEDCDDALIRREIGYVQWVQPGEDADVHVLGNRRVLPPGVAGYEVIFSGLGRFATRADTLHYTPAEAEPPHQRQAGLVHTIQLGLVRYAADTPLARRLQVSFVPAGAADGASAPKADTASAAQTGTAAARSRQSARDDRRWGGALDLGFSGAAGNSDLIALTTGVRVRHLQTRLFRLDWSANLRYGESGGDVVARHVQSRLNFDMGPAARVGPFIAAAAERDPFRRLDLRSNVGLGMKYSFFGEGRDESTLRGAVLYGYERFTPEADRSPRADGTWRIELKNNRGIGESLRIENTSSYDPVLGDVGDFNVEVKSKVSTRITQRLALTFSHSYTYDSTPVADVGRADQRFQGGITVEL